MSNELAVLDAVSSSNLSRDEKSAIAKWADRVSGGRAAKMIERVGLARGIQVGGVLQSVRAGSESLLVGGGLGLLHAHVGLDVTDKKIPLDGVAAALGLVGGALLAGETVGEDARNLGASAASVYSFRQSFRFAAAKKIKGGAQPKGTFAGEMEDYREEFVDCDEDDEESCTSDGDDFGDEEDDPILRAAKRL
jgi:hypothetical protein